DWLRRTAGDGIEPDSTRRSTLQVGQHSVDRVGFSGRFVVSIAKHSGEAESSAAWISRRLLDPIECDLDNLLRSDVDSPIVFVGLQLLEPIRLPFQYVISQSFEGLAQHHEAARRSELAGDVAGTE